MHMKTSRVILTVICFLLFLSAVVAITLRSRSQKAAPQPAQSSDPQPASPVAGYRQWTRVNHKPALVAAQSAILCAIQSSAPSPHASKYITVYVNDLGRHAMMEEKTP